MLAKPDNQLVLGKTGSGKSVKVRNLIAGRRRVLVFDPTGYDYSDQVIIEGLDQLKAFWRRVYQGPFRLTYWPTGSNVAAEFEAVCELAWACQDLTIVGEEMDQLCRPQQVGLNVSNVLRRGRKRDIRTVFVTQRPYRVDRDCTAQATSVWIFHTDEPRDIAYIAERWGQAMAERVKNLGPYEWAHKSIHTPEIEYGRDEL